MRICFNVAMQTAPQRFKSRDRTSEIPAAGRARQSIGRTCTTCLESAHKKRGEDTVASGGCWQGSQSVELASESGGFTALYNVGNRSRLALSPGNLSGRASFTGHKRLVQVD